MDVADMYLTLDLHGFEDIEESDRDLLLNDVIQEICTEAAWPFLDSVITIDASVEVDSDGLVSLPDPISAVRNLRQVDSPYTRARYLSEDDLIEHNIDLTETGVPAYFYFVGENLYLWPIPTSGNYRIGVVLVHPDLDADSEAEDILLPARHHRLIVLGMLYKLHSQEDDAENAAMFKQQFDERLMRMRQDLWKKQYDRPESMRIYGWDDWADEA
jgi:hypothetical protein